MNPVDRWACKIGVALLYLSVRFITLPDWIGGVVLIWGVVGVIELSYDSWCTRQRRRGHEGSMRALHRRQGLRNPR